MSQFHVRKAEYRQMADRLRDLSMVARHREIQAELNWLADSYDRLAERMEGNENLFGGEEAAAPGLHETAAPVAD